MRVELLNVIDGVTTDALRKEEDTRLVVHQRVKDLLAQHDWGITDDDEDESAEAGDNDSNV